ncbi:MAG: GGDEF domain-containing protein [Lachnospiraceae bacterium]|nr:GGDEF domain-containing protein [Lachnospiraceae bacterium]
MIYSSAFLKDNNKASIAHCSMGHDFIVILGDETFYFLLQKTGGISFLDILPEKDRSEFKEACLQLEPNDSIRTLTSITNAKEKQFLCDIIVSNNGKYLNGQPVWNVTIYHLNYLESQYVTMMDKMRKYRSCLALYGDYLFDYDQEMDRFSVFKYLGTSSSPFIVCTLDDFKNIMAPVAPSLQVKDDLFSFLDRLATTKDGFEITLDFPNVRTFKDFIKCDIKVGVLKKDTNGLILTGIIRPADTSNDNFTPYYATKEAKDTMTGLLNKRASQEYSNALIEMNPNAMHYCIVMDIDNFKNVNDNYGHMFGDEVICKVGETMNTVLNSRGFVGRFGGDEFYMFTDHVDSEEKLRTILTAIRKEIYYAYEDRFPDFHPTLSFGISLYPTDGKRYDELFKIADKCLYIAKEKGRNRFIIYDPEKHASIAENVMTRKRALSPAQRAEYLATLMGDIAIELSKHGKDYLQIILDTLAAEFDLDGIRIYKGKPSKLIMHSGTYKTFPDIEQYLYDEEYLNYFDTNHVMMLGHMTNFEANHKAFAQATMDCSIMAGITFFFPQDDGSNLYMFYDIFNHSARWADSDKNLLLVMSRLLSYYFNDYENNE